MDARILLRQEQAKRRTEEQEKKGLNGSVASSKKRKAIPEDQSQKKKARNSLAQPPSLATLPEDVELESPATSTAPLPDVALEDDLALRPQSVSKDANPSETAYVDLHRNSSLSNVPAVAVEVVDEDEWAAFERDVATPPPDSTTTHSNVFIEAAPISAADIAAQAREEQSAQRGRREAEVDDEREDAARQMDEEFEEMEGLEERIRKLKEKRESLRQAQSRTQEAIEVANARRTSLEDSNFYESDEDEDEDVDEWDSLGLR